MAKEDICSIDSHWMKCSPLTKLKLFVV